MGLAKANTTKWKFRVKYLLLSVSYSLSFSPLLRNLSCSLSSSNAVEAAVSAQRQSMAALRDEVDKLKNNLASVEEQREEAVRQLAEYKLNGAAMMPSSVERETQLKESIDKLRAQISEEHSARR